ncbi:hypothetical protein PUNSTDRAFT_56361 [Punctularia strigosozonata HHB-11173 SS5]|uniref:uncharacterized protein n=1 Tax=Punctularia strigosozonata (strain HHB-11173) TaxID=741275 RepID=UPI0004417AD6|nr:uncharacterized protein PUNSTDRAFT_56361 [Punctularia strigosozonata HHB-11173 SS5]EIN14624.1 hypothetical protein PUNSTDRAFT_56361 [Punctularia strigosozonata HHB-11173 SS5]
MQFHDLPVELLVDICAALSKPSHLARVSLVNKTFCAFATPRLYQRIYIYSWHKEGKANIPKLFRTLAECIRLAQYVKYLEIRDFPRALTRESYASVMETCLVGIANCTNLKSCTWTRDGSMTSDVLRVLSGLPALEFLAINGHSNGNYDPSVLRLLKRIKHISIIMPSSDVVNMLQPWVQELRGGLRGLTLICKASNLITDELLTTLAVYVPGLEEFQLVGCPKVTHSGVAAVVSASQRGIKSLGLEGVSSVFDMTTFAHECHRTRAMIHLTSVTLSVPSAISKAMWLTSSDDSGDTRSPDVDDRNSGAACSPQIWFQSVLSLLNSSPLHHFHIYSSGGRVVLPDSFVRSIVDAHCTRLKRFSVHRMVIRLRAIKYICELCERLEDLFVHVHKGTFYDLGPVLQVSRTIEKVHVNIAPDMALAIIPGGDDEPEDDEEEPIASASSAYVPPHVVLGVVRAAGERIVQFGCNTRVYQVAKVPVVLPSGEVQIVRELRAYESPDIPEQFLVVRT